MVSGGTLFATHNDTKNKIESRKETYNFMKVKFLNAIGI
jgi:hypothetical protein